MDTVNGREQVDGIYCSNHGGRQADGGIPALDCLPDVVDAADDVPVLFDLRHLLRRRR